MERFLPAKRAMLTFYILLAAVGAALNVILYRYVTMLPIEILKAISLTLWAVILAAAIIVVPHYFITAKAVITKNEIASAGGFINYRNDYMPVSSIKSVSVIITPLGKFTGINFVVINALGSRMLLSFYRKDDAIAMAKKLNEMIRERS